MHNAITQPVVLAAPAAFKGTFGPRQVAGAVAAGIRRALPEAAILLCPISDGGDGLLDAVLPPDSRREHVPVTGPLGAPVKGVLGWVDAETAIFESATACGIALLRPEELDPLRTTTRGVGELIREAVERGAKVVVVGLGGSATVDGGTGAGRGLGWTCRDAEGAPLPDGGGALARLADLGGGGARGGLGAGLAFFAKAQLTPGAEWVLSRVGFDAALARADFVVTGEGSFDRTSLVGKASGEVVRRAQAAKKQLAVVAGKVEGWSGVHALDGGGSVLDAAGIAALAERATREAFGLPQA